ncbi:MAG: hypothetical protein IPQ02_02475 [Saprospiraceae bacterium]|nr:hypothetical protein [Candidatus Defluviibacterium haderslevense]
MIWVCPFFLRIFTNNFATAISIWPFIFLKHKYQKNDAILINHEKIHLQQQAELLILPFYIWYLLEYLFYRLKGYKKHAAYHSISFEREAYEHDSDLSYLNSRKKYAFIGFLVNRNVN